MLMNSHFDLSFEGLAWLCPYQLQDPHDGGLNRFLAEGVIIFVSHRTGLHWLSRYCEPIGYSVGCAMSGDLCGMVDLKAHAAGPCTSGVVVPASPRWLGTATSFFSRRVPTIRASGG